MRAPTYNLSQLIDDDHPKIRLCMTSDFVHVIRHSARGIGDQTNNLAYVIHCSVSRNTTIFEFTVIALRKFRQTTIDVCCQ